MALKPLEKHMFRFLLGGLILFIIETIRWGIFSPNAVQLFAVLLLFGALMIGLAGTAVNWEEKKFGPLLVILILAFSFLLVPVLGNQFASSFMAFFIVGYLVGTLVFYVAENVMAGFFKPLYQNIRTKREYNRWRKKKERKELKAKD